MDLSDSTQLRYHHMHDCCRERVLKPPEEVLVDCEILVVDIVKAREYHEEVGNGREAEEDTRVEPNRDIGNFLSDGKIEECSSLVIAASKVRIPRKLSITVGDDKYGDACHGA